MDQLTFCFEGHNVRFVGTSDKPEWVAKDVCKCLLIKNVSDALSDLEPQDKGIVLNDTPSGQQEMLTVTESGLYALIFKSRKPEAKRFKRWVFEEVLPSIRKTGSYSIQPLSPTQAIIQALQLWEQVQEEQQRQAVELAVTKALAQSTEAKVTALEVDMATLKAAIAQPIPKCKQTARQRIVELAQLMANVLIHRGAFNTFSDAIKDVWNRINLKVRNSAVKVDLASRKSFNLKQYEKDLNAWELAGKPKGKKPSKQNYAVTIPAVIESLSIEQDALECTVSVAQELVVA
jgi:prophage antirepressor-like protein